MQLTRVFTYILFIAPSYKWGTVLYLPRTPTVSKRQSQGPDPGVILTPGPALLPCGLAQHRSAWQGLSWEFLSFLCADSNDSLWTLLLSCGKFKPFGHKVIDWLASSEMCKTLCPFFSHFDLVLGYIGGDPEIWELFEYMQSTTWTFGFDSPYAKLIQLITKLTCAFKLENITKVLDPQCTINNWHQKASVRSKHFSKSGMET